jgi:hypothetical protein
MRRTDRLIWTFVLSASLILVLVLLGQAGARSRAFEESLAHLADSPAEQAALAVGAAGWQMVGQVGGHTEDVAVQGDPSTGSEQVYAYIAVGLRLVVLDVSQLMTPTEVGSTTPFPQFVEGVAVSGTVAYVADGMSGLRIVDVSDPAAPFEVEAYDTPGYAEGVAVDGQYAYVADGHYGLRIVDVSDPAEAVEVAYAYPLNYVFDVAVDGQYAYLAAAGAGLLVVDVSDPAHPLELGFYDTPGYAYGVDVTDGVAYVADGWEHLQVVDVSDPAHLVRLTGHETPGWSFGVTVSGTVAYVADAFAGLQVVDVSDPTDPSDLGGYEMAGGHAGRVVVMGSTAYVADRNRGLRVVDVSDLGAPAQIGFYGPLGHAEAVAVSGDHAYVAAATYGLRVVDISDPAHPVEVGAYDTHGNAIGVSVIGNYAYVADFGSPGVGAGLHVVDVSDPAHPLKVGYSQPVGVYRDIAVAGGVAYLANEWGLDLIDVSSPYTPVHAGTINLMGEEWAATEGVDISGTLAYVSGAGGLHIVDVSNPVSPTLISNFYILEGYSDVTVAGTRAYVTGGGNCLKIIDVSDPLHPAQLGAYCGPALPGRVTVVSSTAFVAFGSAGVYSIDVTNAMTPTLTLSYDTPGYAFASVVAGNTIYVADKQGGLVIFEMGADQSGGSMPRWGKAASAGTPVSRRAPGQPSTPAFSEEVPPIRRSGQRIGVQHILTPHHRLNNQLGPNAHRFTGTCVITSTADSGSGTLRQCMEDATSGDTITFDPAVFSPESPVTITLQDNLPTIWQGDLTIDASEAGVILNGSQIEDGTGLNIFSSGIIIRGLQIVYFSNAGILVGTDADNNTIGGDRTIGSGPMGQGNLISGNGLGIGIGGNSNLVVGNFIGTDVSGLHAFGNRLEGIGIASCQGNRIGGTSPGERNIISANGWDGVGIRVNATGNSVVGNYIGTDVSGTIDLGNEWTGVIIELGSPHNTVKNNLVSGSNWGGVIIADVGSEYNTVVGNLIGTDATGTQALGNRWCGVGTGESFNRIGGTSPGDRNIIAGNPQGIALAGEHNLILGNFIGTSISGTESISNGQGIFIAGSSSHNFVGGTTSAERNIISGNDSEGVAVGGTGPNLILGNYIGTDVSGMAALGNQWSGIALGATQYSVIQGNLIGGNEETGISIGEGSDFSHLRANRIGVAADGASPLPNSSDGVSISAASNIIGGTYPEDGNVIAYNGNVGIQVWTHAGNTIRRNPIYGNAGPGIFLADGGNNSLPAPIITEVLPTSVSGSACPGCIVELFSDEADEGRVYEGYTVADGNGAWTWMGSPNGPYVTATATDGTGNTSPFSAPQVALWHQLYLPLILKGEDTGVRSFSGDRSTPAFSNAFNQSHHPFSSFTTSIMSSKRCASSTRNGISATNTRSSLSA